MMKLHYILLLTLVLLTASCGFHLRGSLPGSTTIDSVSINDATASGVGAEVKALLEASGTDILPSPDNGYGLRLTDQLLNRSVLSVSAVTGKVEEYQLTLTVGMTVTDPDGNELLSGQQIRVTRDYAFDDAAVLGSVTERRVLEQEMIRQAASQIVRRLNALARQP